MYQNAWLISKMKQTNKYIYFYIWPPNIKYLIQIPFARQSFHEKNIASNRDSRERVSLPWCWLQTLMTTAIVEGCPRYSHTKQLLQGFVYPKRNQELTFSRDIISNAPVIYFAV